VNRNKRPSSAVRIGHNKIDQSLSESITCIQRRQENEDNTRAKDKENKNND